MRKTFSLIAALLMLPSTCGFLGPCLVSKRSFGVSMGAWQAATEHPGTASIDEATRILTAWDTTMTKLVDASSVTAAASRDATKNLSSTHDLAAAVRLLTQHAQHERAADQNQGRCMLGICAASADQGIATLKAWVTSLQLPRGLLHGMDKDGVPLVLDGAVYIKYNTGGSLTFAQIRQSGLGFDALWKPGDALLEPYEGDYRGVYFQVELADGEFRQFLVPLDTFTLD